jgi:hypothetical protein
LRGQCASDTSEGQREKEHHKSPPTGLAAALASHPAPEENEMPTTYLNLTDLDNRIRSLENKHRASSFEMLTDESVRNRISEDVLLKWETYVRQQTQLRELNDHEHSEYLRHIGQKDKTQKAPEDSDKLVFAA